MVSKMISVCTIFKVFLFFILVFFYLVGVFNKTIIPLALHASMAFCLCHLISTHARELYANYTVIFQTRIVLYFYLNSEHYCPSRVLAEPKTRGGTLGSPACIHTRNFKKVRNALVVWEVFPI